MDVNMKDMSFAFSRSNSPGKSQQSQMPKPPTKLTFNTDRILWKWVRHGTRLRRARDVGRMQTRASTDREEQQVQWQTPQRHGSAGREKESRKGFPEDTHQDKVGSRCYLVEKVLRGRGMSKRRDERSGLCCDRRHVVLKTRWLRREVGLEWWAEAGSFCRGTLNCVRRISVCCRGQG